MMEFKSMGRMTSQPDGIEAKKKCFDGDFIHIGDLTIKWLQSDQPVNYCKL